MLAFLVLLGALAGASATPMNLRSPFLGSELDDWSFSGSAVVTDTYVRLTPAEAGHEGSVWSKNVMPYSAWEIEMSFKVTGARYLGGDGFALWFTEQRDKFGATFGNQEDFKGVGIIFDTYDNDGKRDNPSIMAVVSDGTQRFDHDSDGKSEKIPGGICKVNYRNPRNPVQVRIRYHDAKLVVAFDTRGQRTWQDCFVVEDVAMPKEYYIGLTAHTGQVADNHDIFSFATTNLGPEPPELESNSLKAAEARQQKQRDADVKQGGEKTGALKDEKAAGAEASKGPAEVGQADRDEREHEWKDDDDRHLRRFQESVTRWSAASEEERERLSRKRKKDLAEGRRALDGEDAIVENEPNESKFSFGRAAMPSDAEASMQGLNDSVASTLAAIQAEIKAIAHEMRGTITLAHAVTSQAPSSEGTAEAPGGAGGVSTSELLVGVSEMISGSERTIMNDVSTLAATVKQDLFLVRQDMSSLQDLIRNNLLRTDQEVSSKLSSLTNEIHKLKEVLNDMHRKQEGHTRLHEKVIQTVESSGEKNASSWGISLWLFILSHLPWVVYLMYSRFAAEKGGRGGMHGGGILGGGGWGSSGYSSKRDI